MSALQTALTEYSAMRRALGFKLRDVGRWLDQFVRFAETEEAGFITTAMRRSHNSYTPPSSCPPQRGYGQPPTPPCLACSRSRGCG
jgi:hypothetical protein